jgi:UDP-N-acetylmuramoylalanine--D-glutamate ligase
MNLQGKRVVVVGMARSGLAAVELLADQGAQVIAVDQNAAKLFDLGIAVESQTERAFEDSDLIVLSPGVPADLAELESARQRGVKVIGDLELASWLLKGDIIGITGANGKTTTTALTGHILRESGIDAQVGGNIGTPPASMVKTSRDGQWNVLELSSFQLETTELFRAHIGAALNVTPDHLDRHHTLANYAAAKGRLFVNQRDGDFAVLNRDDSICFGYASLSAGKPVWFSSTRRVFNGGAWFDGVDIRLNGQTLMAGIDVPLRGLHNIENAMAAAVIANLAGATAPQIRAAILSFPGVEHRLEFVGSLDGVAWYNDSKATNVDATLKAIHAFPGGLWVILGGKDKDSDYSVLAKPLQERAHGALLIGAAAEKIAAQLNGALPLISCSTLDHAVAEARLRARSGDTVLLAPACASFDQFENYEHRGREFKRMALAIHAGQEAGWQN